MNDIQYTAHVTFIPLEGKLTPYQVTFTNVLKPNVSHIIHLDMDDKYLLFDHEDLLHNMYVYIFPQRKRNSIHVAKNMDDYVKEFYETHLGKAGGWDTVIGAVDKPICTYLEKILPHVIHLPEMDPGLAWTTFACHDRNILNNEWEAVDLE